jgi:hypothetical protein
MNRIRDVTTEIESVFARGPRALLDDSLTQPATVDPQDFELPVILTNFWYSPLRQKD